MKSCPKHGTKYLETTEDGITICMAPIPRDKYGLRNCYYEIPNKPGPKPAVNCITPGCNNKPVYGRLCKQCRRKKQRERYKKRK